MANGWSAKDVAIPATKTGVLANQPLSAEFPLTAGGAVQGLKVKITTSAVTQVGTVTLKFQTANGSDWVDTKSATITASGITYIKFLAADASDQTYMPLLNKGRIVLTMTNAGDSVSIASADSIQVLQEL